MGKYTKYAIGGTLAGLGIGALIDKHKKKRRDELDETYKTAIRPSNSQPKITNSEFVYPSTKVLDLTKKSQKSKSEHIPVMKKLGNTPDNPVGKPSIKAEKIHSVGSHIKDTAKEAYSQFSHSPKAQMIAGGTAAALGAGLAAKRYLQHKRKS